MGWLVFVCLVCLSSDGCRLRQHALARELPAQGGAASLHLVTAGSGCMGRGTQATGQLHDRQGAELS